MLRHTRLVMIALAATFIVAVPAAVAQTPTADQYQTAPPAGGAQPTDDAGAAPVDDAGAAPDDDAGAAPVDDAGAAPVDDAGAAPVAVANAAPGSTNNLPYTGGQISLIALIGLGLLALGMVGLAVTRKRASSAAA